jgi:clavulanate-9-aldehyde reductase
MIEPGAVDTELRTHITQEQARRRSEEQASDIRQLQPQDIAHVVVDVVTRLPHMSINEVLVRPTDQSW